MLIDKVIDELNNIRPFLQEDGGDVEFVELKDRTVFVRLTGTCGSCPFSESTLRMRIEKSLLEAIPEIEHVQSV
ncbi:MAG: NifU family protein [Candidatus Zhuqueibacterota bacterium]